ncbi:MAG: lipopolysaccharide biosynthesis protein [Betaproteobacteria bacterium]
MTRSRTLGGSMAHGIAWMLLFKVVDRAVGFVSVIVLARLLVPADFGLIALAMSAIALLDALGAFGLETALIQRADARREHFDAVWSFNVANGALTGAVGIAIAWWVAAFYGDERLVAVMFVLSIARIVRGFENVGVVAFRKEMEFDREFRYLVAKRLTTTVLVTLPLAFVLHNYWALLIGTLAGTSIGVALSYAMHPFRPRLSFAGIGPLLHFSKWLYLTSLIEFAHGRVADVMVGRWTGAAAVGSLAMARELARFPTQELSAPVNRAVFPGYVKLAGDRGGLRRGYLKVTSALLLMILPAGVGLSLLAEPVTRALIGEKWLAAIPLIQVLSINGIMGVLLGTAYHVNLAVGMSRSTTMVLAIKIAIALPLMFWTIPEYGAQGAVLSMFVALLATMPLNWLLLRRAIEFGWSEVTHILWRPLAGTVAMSAAVFATRYAWPTPAGLFEQVAYLAMLVTGGALVYAVVVYLLWKPQSDPESAEAWALAQGRRALAAAGARFAQRR